jgi:hypothetical protein
MHGTRVPSDGDVDGLLCKIGNEGVIDVDEWMACYTRREIEGKGKDDVMVTWGGPFVPVAFKTLGLFNIFQMVVTNVFQFF